MAILPAATETRFKGLPLSPGVAVARVCLFNERRHVSLPISNVTDKEVRSEGDRFRKALSFVREKLAQLIKEVEERIGKAEAEIFTAQKMILEDPVLIQRVTDHIRSKHFNAEKAVISSLDFFEGQLAEMDNAYIRERSSDIGEVKRRMLDALANLNPSFQCESDSFCQKGKNRIVIAQELTPSLTMELNTDFIRGFVTDRGGVASHAAILARALRIPAVSGIPEIHDMIFCGTEVLVNGDTGEVMIWPSQKTLAEYPDLQREITGEVPTVEPVAGLKVFANLSLAKKVKEAVDHKAEGIGLYRTEFEFFAAGKVLCEVEQYDLYLEVLKTMKDKPVYFRMLDLGGDKTADFLKFPKEQNPALGLRGSRLLLGHPELFKNQARALARASRHGHVHVMYPMVIDIEQFRKLKKAFEEATSDIPQGEIKHGLMFEVPSACLDAEEILKEADFGSIGTNDLIQYLFAVDRDNEFVAYDHHPDRKIFWHLIHHVAHAAKKHRKPLSVCGELASNPVYTRKLLAAGIHAVSVAPRAITGLRIAIKNKPKLAKKRISKLLSGKKK
ncbi:MAG: phosphoenolpyruvate--protein phosphotransferase [Candidatus Omnitrophota bacterium]